MHVNGICKNEENIYLLSGLSSVSRQEDKFGKLITRFM